MLFISIGGVFFIFNICKCCDIIMEKNLNVYYCLVIVISFKYFRCFLL